MADRTVKVTLIANATGYVQGMTVAAQKTRELGTEAEKLAARRQAFTSLGMAALAVGVAASIGVGMAVSKFMQFDQAMSNVNAVTQETTQNQLLLRDAALEAGGATVYTATEAANAIEELAKAGISTSNVLSGALYGSLNLAASGQLEVARAAEVTGITLKQFSLDGAQAGRVADVLSAGANKAVGSVEDLAQGLKFVGPVAANMNVSLEDTVATLALFADQGILGEQAGTSLRGMLSSLTSPSAQARDEIERLGVSLYDNSGRFLGLENAAGQLNQALGGVSDAERDMALGILFGNQQVTAARVLVSAGAQTWREYRNAVDDSGIAARIANERLDNLAGDVEKLGGAFDTALIRTGSGANDVLRSLTQTATFVVDAIGAMPEPVLATALALGVATAGVAALAAATLLGVPRWAAFKAAIVDLNTSLGTVALKAGLAGAAITVATIVVGAWVTAAAESAARTNAFADSLDKATGATTKYTRELAVKNLQESGAFDVARKLGISTADLTDALMRGGPALAEYTQRFRDYDAVTRTAQSGQVYADFVSIRRELEAAPQAWKDTTQAMGGTAEGLDGIASAASGAREEVDAAANAIRGFGSRTLDTREAHRQLMAAIDDANASLAENGATLDRSTAAGRENEAALDAIAKRTLAYSAAIQAQTGNTREAAIAVEAGRETLIRQLEQFGITGEAAESYADQLGLIPENVYTAVDLNTTNALNELNRFIVLASGRRVEIPLVLTPEGRQDYISQLQRQDLLTPRDNYRGGLWEAGVRAFAGGGFASGIYSDRKGPLYKFAEPGVGWEAFISGAPAYRQQNIGYAYEALDRLGALPASFPPPASFVAPVTGGGGDSGVMQELVAGVVAAIREHPTVVEIDGQPVAAAVREFNRALR